MEKKFKWLLCALAFVFFMHGVAWATVVYVQDNESIVIEDGDYHDLVKAHPNSKVIDVFGDGSFVIVDADYQDRVEAQESNPVVELYGTESLVIEAGDYYDRVEAHDNSTVYFNGGEVKYLNLFDDSVVYFAGGLVDWHVALSENSRAYGNNAGARYLVLADYSMADLTDFFFGGVFLYGASTLNASGIYANTYFYARENSTVNISIGDFGCPVHVQDNSQVTLVNVTSQGQGVGNITASGNAVVDVLFYPGGYNLGYTCAQIKDYAMVNLHGGGCGGNDTSVRDFGVLNIFGYDLELVQWDPHWPNYFLLTGFWADGTPIPYYGIWWIDDSSQVNLINLVSVETNIMPHNCNNISNIKSKGSLRAAIFGTEDFDVTDIDPTTVRLAGFAPLKSAVKDISKTVADESSCIEEGPDGIDDLSLEFDTEAIVDVLRGVSDGEAVKLTLTGQLYDGTFIGGTDYIVVVARGGGKTNCYIGETGVLHGVHRIEDSDDLLALSGYTSIAGSLAIESETLTSLEGLECLNHIGGDLSMYENFGLTSLEGLESLESIGGDLWMFQNDGLTSLEGLESLESVGKSLTISENNSLTNLAGLESLKSVGERLGINENSLTNLTGLAALESVGTDLNIIGNDSLTSLAALERLKSVGGNMRISSNASLTSLTSLTALGRLKSVGGMYIENNAFLTSLAGLEILGKSVNDLRITDNDSLTSLAGLERLKSVNDLRIRYNDSLTNLTGLEGLESVGRVLSIASNSSLISLEGLYSLESIDGDLEIGDNGPLSSLEGLESLKSVGTGLVIQHNYFLTSLDGLGSLESIGGDLGIWANYELCTSLAEALRDQVLDAGGIGGDIEIYDNKTCP